MSSLEFQILINSVVFVIATVRWAPKFIAPGKTWRLLVFLFTVFALNFLSMTDRFDSASAFERAVKIALVFLVGVLVMAYFHRKAADANR